MRTSFTILDHPHLFSEFEDEALNAFLNIHNCQQLSRYVDHRFATAAEIAHKLSPPAESLDTVSRCSALHLFPNELPQSNIAFWSGAEKPPRSDVLPAMAQALGVRLEELLNVEMGRLTAAKKKNGPTGRVREVFDRVSNEQKKKVRTFLAAQIKPEPTFLLVNRVDIDPVYSKLRDGGSFF